MAEWRYFYAVKGLEVSRGGAVRRTYDDCRTWDGKGLYPIMLERQVDKDGNLYIEIRKPKKKHLRIDNLVATCFLPKPKLGQNLIIHKDKNKQHCWADNLQWATPYEYAEFYNTSPSTTNAENVNVNGDSIINQTASSSFRLLWGDVFVSDKGEVKQNDEILKVCDHFYDSDLDIEVAVNPFVYIHNGRRIREDIEELVASAFLPPPKNLFLVLLHKDLDYKNCSSDNLEWVSSDNEDLKKYVEKRKAETNERTFELNPHRVESLKKSHLFD